MGQKSNRGSAVRQCCDHGLILRRVQSRTIAPCHSTDNVQRGELVGIECAVPVVEFHHAHVREGALRPARQWRASADREHPG